MQVPAVKREHLDALARKLKWKRHDLDGMLAVFCELSFLAEEADQYRFQPATTKRPLESSMLYTAWKEEAQLATELLLSSSEGLIQAFHQMVAPEPVT